MKTRFLVYLLLITTTLAFADGERLINGTPADPKDFPASVYASMQSSRCTATVVGEKVLLIAAHCVSNGGTATFNVGPNNYSSKCTHAPDYDFQSWSRHREAILVGNPQMAISEERNATADWSLCVTTKTVTGIAYEMVNQEPNTHAIGDELLLTGYGCVQPGGGGGNDGTYRTGKAKVTGLPSGSSNDIITKGGAALCFGDSGGPAFKVEGDKRWVVSVNSRGDIKTTSYLSSTSTPASKKFFADWATKNAVKICGVHADAVGCRSAQPPLPSFTIDHRLGTFTGTAKPTKEGMIETVKNGFKFILDSIQE